MPDPAALRGLHPRRPRRPRRRGRALARRAGLHVLHLIAPAPLLPALAAHVEAAYPHEACGLIGARDRRYTVRPAANLRPAAEAHAAFELDPAALIACRRAGEEVAALYHSHCDAPATLSAADRAAALIDGRPAWPGVELWVLEVRRARLVACARYRFDPARGDFARADDVSEDR
ncbi:MAG: Mov34/MPN/PAD-1 family protein [Myxococcales bacterium]|nr:Mov34/MPN/PAD-1 family protein [Myxococcales bacterium]